MTETAIASRALELRRAFDEAFAAPLAMAGGDTLDLIGIMLGGQPYALRTGEIDGLRLGVSVTPVPSLVPELMGIAGFRGRLLPVYDLSALLGYPPGNGRWCAFAGASPAGVAFGSFEAHFRVDAAAARPRRVAATSPRVPLFAMAACLGPSLISLHWQSRCDSARSPCIPRKE